MTRVAPRKPLPSPNVDTQGYWDAARQHRLAVLRCRECGTYIHPPRKLCAGCWSAALVLEPVSGRGTVYSFIVVHHVVVPGFEGEIPYVVAMVELREQPGLRLATNIVGCAPADVHIGMAVEVTFEDLTDEITLPKFRPYRGPA